MLQFALEYAKDVLRFSVQNLQVMSSAFACAFQVGFQTIRYYWSMHSLHKRSKLVCTVGEKDGAPEFIVTVEEPGQQNLVFRDPTTKGALLPVLNAIGEPK